MKSLTFIGGSGFIGKSFIDVYKKGLLKKFKISYINIICRNNFKIKKKSNKINIILADMEKLKILPKTDFYIYAIEPPSGFSINQNKQIIKYKKSINNFYELIKNNKNSKAIYLSSGIVEQFLKGSKIKGYKKAYAVAKLNSEKKFKEFRKIGIKSTIARCYTFVGPHLPLNKHYAIGNFINDGMKKKYIYVKASGKIFRSYMYADDMIIWILSVLYKAKISCPIYNIGSNKKISIKDVAILIGKIFKKDVLFLKKESSDRDIYVPNVSKTMKDFNLIEKYDLKKAIKQTVNKIVDNN